MDDFFGLDVGGAGIYEQLAVHEDAPTLLLVAELTHLPHSTPYAYIGACIHTCEHTHTYTHTGI